MNRRILPLAAAASVLALMAGLNAGRTKSDAPAAPTAPAPPTPERAAEPERPTSGSADPCAFPLRWRVARVDEPFGLGREEATSAVLDATRAWETATGRALFVHDESGGFPINFVYDGRQAAAQERLQAQADYDTRTRTVEVERERLQEINARHTAAQAAYDRRVTAHNTATARHNATVRQWNRDRSAPESILLELEATDQRLRREETDLAEEGAALERASEAVAAEIARFDRTVSELNARGEALERVFATGSVLAGRYLEARTVDGRVIPGAREIQVFQFDDPRHLRLVLAHELGHAMGLGHADDTTAVMSEEHELAGGTAALRVREADLDLLGARCPTL